MIVLLPIEDRRGVTDDLIARVADHIGAVLVTDQGEIEMRCPKCGGDFGPTRNLSDLAVYEDGYLPGAPLLHGVCLDCEHITEPTATPTT